ncbi:MAG: hypothetical protein NVS3B28_22450 [Candidatus Velthaea sp.]
MRRFFAKRRELRFELVCEDDPGRIAADSDNARAADFIHRDANTTKTVIIERTAAIADPFARANACDALDGAGRPAGVIDVALRGDEVSVRFDDSITAPELIDDLLAVAIAFVPQRAAPIGDIALAAARVARGVGDPDIDAGRVIETYVP